MATSTTEIISAKDLISRNLAIYDVQRSKNIAWIDEMKLKQISHISKYGTACFPGSIVLVKLFDTSYIVDGQHREQVIRNLIDGGYNLDVKIIVETYDCGTDRDLARDIYLLSNEKYKHNAGVDILRANQSTPTQTPVTTTTHPQIPITAQTPRTTTITPQITVPTLIPRTFPIIQQIVIPTQAHLPTLNVNPAPITIIPPETIMTNLRSVCYFVGNTYSSQLSANDNCPAPKFNIGNLEKELLDNGNGIITKLQPDRIIAIISAENIKLGQILPIEKKNKCTSGFFLPYHQNGAKCRWVRGIFANSV